MPKLEGFTLVRDGIHPGTITGIEYRNANRSDNPMLVVEVALESGALVNCYCVVTVDGSQMYHLLRACGRSGEAEQIKRHKVPDVELDDLIGTQVDVRAFNGSFTLATRIR